MSRNKWIMLVAFMAFQVKVSAQLLTSELPIVVINTGGATILDEPKIAATMGIVFDSTGGVINSNGPFNEYDGRIGIEIRGNVSQEFPKLSYDVQLWSNTNAIVTSELLGIDADADWILHAMYIDKTLLRIPLTFYLAQRMGHYSSNWRFVEMVLDGQYAGVYLLVEKIKQGSNRVDVEVLGAIDNSGGYILKLDWLEGGADFGSKYRSMDDSELKFQYYYPKKSKMSVDQVAYIRNFMDRFEDALFSSDFKNGMGERYSDLADLETFADFLLINELTKNSDGYKLSTFMHKDNDAGDGRLKMGPIWDFDQTYGLAGICGGHDHCGWTYLQNQSGCTDLMSMPMWWEAITMDSVFTNILVERWKQFRTTFLHTDSISDWIDNARWGLDAAIDRNFSKWPILGEEIWAEPDPMPQTYQEEIDYMKEWTEKRSIWIDRNIDNIHVMASTPGHVKLWPNPSSDLTSVIIVPSAIIRVSDLTGREILNSGECTESSYIINVSTWAPGIYIVYVKTTQGVFSGRLLVL